MINAAEDSVDSFTKKEHEELLKNLHSTLSKVINEYKTIYKNLADFVYICEKEGL